MSTIGVQAYHDINNLAKYATGTAINHADSPMTAVKEAGGFAAFSGAAWAFKNRRNLKGAWDTVKASDIAAKSIMQEATRTGKTISNIWKGAGEITAKAQLETIAAGSSSAAGAAQSALSAGTGYSSALEAINAGSKTGILGNVGKCFKGGGGIMAAGDFAVSVFTDVVPAFQLGTTQGFKQIGKSATKAAAVGVGWWAGSALGTKAGAAIGTAICPGIGTVVGAVVGFLGGCLGSWLCGKLASGIVGKSEVEKAKEEQAQQIAQSAASGNGEVSVSDVAKAAYQQLMQNVSANNGKLSKEDKEAKKSLENLIGRKIDIEQELALYETSQQEVTAQAATTQGATSTQTPTPLTTQTDAQTSTQTEQAKEKETKKRETLADLYRSMGLIQTNTNPIYTFGSLTAGYNMMYPQIQMPQLYGQFITGSQYAA